MMPLAAAKHQQERLVERQEVGDQPLACPRLADIAALGEDRDDVRQAESRPGRHFPAGRAAGGNGGSRWSGLLELSKTAMPWSICESAVCSMSWLYCSASLAWSSSQAVSDEASSIRLQDQRQHEPRRGRADGAAEQLLGEMNQRHIGRLVDPPASGRTVAHRSRRSAACAPRRDSGRWRS